MTVILRTFMNKYLPVHTESRGGGGGSLPPSPHPLRTASEMLLWTVCCSCYFSLWRLFLALQHGKHRDAQRKVMAVKGKERETHRTPLAGSVWDLGPPGALWMLKPEWVPWWGDQAHWEQVTRGRECFCAAFGPLTYCPTSALAALKTNIFICEALKREGGAAVRIKSSSRWRLHLLLKSRYDRCTMSLRQPALGEGLS